MCRLPVSLVRGARTNLEDDSIRFVGRCSRGGGHGVVDSRWLGRSFLSWCLYGALLPSFSSDSSALGRQRSDPALSSRRPAAAAAGQPPRDNALLPRTKWRTPLGVHHWALIWPSHEQLLSPFSHTCGSSESLVSALRGVASLRTRWCLPTLFLHVRSIRASPLGVSSASALQLASGAAGRRRTELDRRRLGIRTRDQRGIGWPVD